MVRTGQDFLPVNSHPFQTGWFLLQVGSCRRSVKAILLRKKRRVTEADRDGQREGEPETDPQQTERNKEAENTPRQAASGCVRHSSRQWHISTGEMS